MQAGLDPQGSRHIDLGQRCHGDGVTSTLSQVDSTQCQVDGQQMSPSLLPCRNGDGQLRHGVSQGIVGTCGAQGSCPSAPMAQGCTGEVELVQTVISHGSIAGTLADVGRGRGVRAQPPSPGSQPATHPEALEQVAQERPEQAAGQVPVGGWQWPPQSPERRAQVLGPLREVSLQPREREGQCGQGEGTGQVGQGTWCSVGHTRSRSRSACRRCRQKRMEGSEWGRVTGSPQTKSRTTAPSTSATFSAQKASVGHSHRVHPHESSVQGWGQQHPTNAALCPPQGLQPVAFIACPPKSLHPIVFTPTDSTPMISASHTPQDIHSGGLHPVPIPAAFTQWSLPHVHPNHLPSWTYPEPLLLMAFTPRLPRSPPL